MGIKATQLNNTLVSFIKQQSLFFVATAAAGGRVNLSPKGLDSLRVVNNQQIIWLSVTGSGNETAAHIRQQPRMTLMFCAFTGDHLILRLYGTASVVHPRDQRWEQLYRLFPDYAGARNIFTLDVDLVTTACGSGVPEMTLLRHRAETDLVPWYENMGQDGVEAFWKKKNQLSIDGDPTGLLD